MTFDPDAAYQVLLARDARFDGRLFVGVTSTGIYCRPICRVRTPLQKNCRFFATPAQAEAATFRPCMKCRPEIAPGPGLAWTVMDASRTLARQAASALDDDTAEGEATSVAALARRLGVSDRHLRRIFGAEHGVTPLQYVQTRRLLLAKQLLTDTRLPVAQVALTSGFRSLRRFNAAFLANYRMNPARLRKTADAAVADGAPKSAPARGARAASVAICLQGVLGGRVASASGARDSRDAGAVVAAGAAGDAHALAARNGRAAQRDDGNVAVSPGFNDESITVTLGYRDPYDIASLLSFISLRAIPGIEAVDESAMTIRRSVRAGTLAASAGWVEASFRPQAAQVRLRFAAALAPASGRIVATARRWLDLDAAPEAIDATLAELPGAPGLRLPGGVDAFELAVRAVLGQQVTVAGARTLAHRLVRGFGEAVVTPWADIDRAFPSPARLAAAGLDEIAALGIIRTRAAAIGHIARAWPSLTLLLQPRSAAEPLVEALRALAGIGPWTAHYIAMRALGWPDAFPPNDVAVLKAMQQRYGIASAREAEAHAHAWQPWRSYAVLRLWNTVASKPA